MRDLDARTLLILGGTAEAASLARAAHERHGGRVRVITSLAGRTSAPVPIPGEVRRGGFGGAEGLAAFLRERRVDLLIDATHPFAAQIARHARLAAELARVPRLVLERPPWPREAGDRWIEVRDMAQAAQRLPELGRRAFLTVGARELAAFAAVRGVAFVVRLIEAPREPLALPGAALVVARPPFELADELLLLQTHGIDMVVAKASGGALPAKLVAARDLSLPVVMVARPRAEEGASVASVAAALDWIAEQLGLTVSGS